MKKKEFNFICYLTAVIVALGFIVFFMLNQQAISEYFINKIPK